MDLKSINTSAELLAATTETAELTNWQKIMRIALSPDALREIAMGDEVNFCVPTGNFGNIFDMEKVFESGYIPKHKKE